MKHSRKTRFTLLIAASFATALSAAETAPVSSEMKDLFSSNNSRQSAIETKEMANRQVATEDNEAIRPSARVAKTAKATKDQAEPTTKNVPARSEDLVVKEEKNAISYTLPKTIETPSIELMTLKGDVITSKSHKFQDVGGVIDTTSLSTGTYIIRIRDQSGKNAPLSRAVAINK